MNAVIVAAGMGNRLAPVTDGRPKCLTPIQGVPLVTRALDALESRGIEKTLIVVGHRHHEIRDIVGDRADFLVNPFYRTTNNMASLWLAVPHLMDAPFLYLHSDVAFTPEVLDPLLKHKEVGIALLVDADSIDEEAMKVRVEEGRFQESSKTIPLDQAAGEWTGIARFSPDAARRFYGHAGELLLSGEHQAYDTAAFNRLAREGTRFPIAWTQGLPWIEIDTPDDLEEARRLFPSPSPGKEATP